MKSSTDELLDLSFDMDTEPPRTGFTGGLDLYGEMMDFAPSPLAEQAVGKTYEHNAPAIQHAPTEAAGPGNPSSAKPAADSGPLPHTGDVIRITGPLAGFGRMAAAAMIACGDCGNQTPGGEMFCIHCGGLIEAEAANAEAAVTPANLCEDCGGAVESDEIFCPSCGTVMATA